MTRRQSKVLQKAFLEAFAKLGSVTQAAKQAGLVDRTLHYRWLERDPKYAEAYKTAEEQSIESLELEARRRAMVGTEEPVFHQGKEVGSVRKYSDTLLIFLLKGARPEKYRERFEHTNALSKQDLATIVDRMGVVLMEKLGTAELDEQKRNDLIGSIKADWDKISIN